jgi:hypothetical protein
MTTPNNVKVYWSKFQKSGLAWRVVVRQPDGSDTLLEIRSPKDSDLNVHTQWLSDQVLERVSGTLASMDQATCALDSEWPPEYLPLKEVADKP